jgi:prepilin-type N-terminal cleavage/methylation domain-containing protein
MVKTMRSRQAGFTAVETMVVVLILAILAAFAAPAMNGLIRTQKVRSAAYDIFADLTYARSEAINRGHDILVSSSGGTDWVSGWALRDTVSGEVIRQQGALSSGITFVGDASSVTYDRNGRISGTSSNTNVRFNIAPTESAPDTQKRCVRLSPSGRPNALEGVCP